MPHRLEHLLLAQIADEGFHLVGRGVRVFRPQRLPLLLDAIAHGLPAAGVLHGEGGDAGVAAGHVHRHRVARLHLHPGHLVLEAMLLLLVQVLPQVPDEGVALGVVNGQGDLAVAVAEVAQVHQAGQAGDMVFVAVGQEHLADAEDLLAQGVNDPLPSVQQQPGGFVVEPGGVEGLGVAREDIAHGRHISPPGGRAQGPGNRTRPS